MASIRNTLRFGELNELIEVLGEAELTRDQVRAVLMNLVGRLEEMESSIAQTANTASCLANGIKPD